MKGGGRAGGLTTEKREKRLGLVGSDGRWPSITDACACRSVLRAFSLHGSR